MGLNTTYLICAIAGGTILVLRLVMMLIGLDQGDAAAGADVSLDLGQDGALDDGSNGGVNFLSLQSIAGFFTMFGLVGVGLLQINAAPALSLLGALAAGALTAWVTGFIFLKLQRLQSEGTLVISNAIGQVGTVYLTIPENASGVVTVSVQGAMRSLDAVAEHGKSIPTGSIVRVVGITAGKILVVTEQTADH
jgi:ABC-type transport system involved in cytochrome c biogenesis permease subunit